ncbi:NAD+ synthase [Parasulfuritortus cantonensis]|uniref:Glutamine-dependent NAD(+) synthetase n=1 Tax=Parasulfuritortus cantonensis TaxID=2528202 RepID=A0A4R1B7Q4_9PROT|nr:NAD+ synthase [Parasulfuritortus cantonensis]TCJ11759.1 NAD+ synthase [Parasulfuritortus cantonensis]
MKIALAQFNATVGDLDGNAGRILALAAEAERGGASLLVTPELALCGYPPEDLALRDDFYRENACRLERLAADLPAGLPAVVGFPLQEGEARYNAAALLRGGRIEALYRKQWLPNHSVFDEMRTFVPGDAALVFELAGHRFGVVICEDIWQNGPAEQARAAGAETLLVLNASPYHKNKQPVRHAVVREQALAAGVAVVYVNLVGGQDELVFDGGSFAVSAMGELSAQFPLFEEALCLVDFADGVPSGPLHRLPDLEEGVYRALVLGVRDYVEKNAFPGVIVGSSGGIDSALTLCIAVDALGPGRVKAVMMPSQYTADMSLTDARALADRLGIEHSVLPIRPLFDGFRAALAGEFAGLAEDLTEENIQARVRGVLLMALSNKSGRMVLTTGNKSEMAAGYATLYGDMAGGYAALKDVAKTLVWRLARYRNTISAVIPERIITRPPSAELRPDQTDQDSLPPYEVLDAIMERYMELDMAPREIVAEGYAEADVRRVVRLIDRSEYKRRQSAPGVRITQRGFGRDRRYPITNKYQAPF